MGPSDFKRPLGVKGFETLTIDATAAGIGPTLSVYGGGTAPTSSARFALFGPLELGQVRWRDDGTDPTAAVGHQMNIGDVLEYDGPLEKIKFIRTGGTSGSIPVTYYRG